MPAAIPAIAAVGGYLATNVAIGYGISIMGAVAIGALAGGVIGGLGAAITGGDIGEGVLWGAVGGAVGGVIANYFPSSTFASLGKDLAAGGTATVSAGSNATQGSIITQLGGQAQVVSGTGGAGGVVTGGTGSLLGGDSMTKFALAQGGMGLLSGATAKTDYTKTEEGTAAILAQRERENQMSKENTLASLAQRQKEAELQAQLTRETAAKSASEFDKTLAQRKLELQTPYDEASAARKRMIDTSLGLKQNVNRTSVSDEINNYIYG